MAEDQALTRKEPAPPQGPWNSQEQFEKMMEFLQTEQELRKQQLDQIHETDQAQIDSQNKEIESRNFQAQLQHDAAMANLEAVKTDRKDTRDTAKEITLKSQNKAIYVVLALLVFTGAMVWQGEKDLAVQIVSHLVTLFLGAGGGYAGRIVKENRERGQNSD